MYCTFCGKEIKDGEECPCRLNIPPKMTKSKKTAIILAAAICTVILLIICLLAVPSKIDPFKYVDVTYSGFNTGGGANILFDKDALIYSIIGNEPTLTDPAEIDEWYSEYLSYEINIKLSCSNTDGLSNGDDIKVTITVTGAASQKIQSGEKVFTVSGLKEVNAIDFFKDISIRFDGISGEATANIVRLSDDEALKACHFAVDSSYNLCSGDTVTVTISNVDYLAEEYNCVPAETSKTYIVPALSEYVQTADQLPLDTIKEIIKKYVADAQPKDEAWFTYSEATYYKTVFSTSKENSTTRHRNLLQIFIVYDEYLDGVFRQTNYIPLQFANVIQQADGTVNINYSDGYTSVFTTDIEGYLQGLKEDYYSTELVIDRKGS